MISRGVIFLGQLSLALVWLYEGLLAKIIGQRPDERAIVDSIPFLPDSWSAAVVVVIGSYELVLAGLILIGIFPRLVALIQTITVVGFNAGGLIFGGDQIPEPTHLLINNFALIMLAWLVALGIRAHRRRAYA